MATQTQTIPKDQRLATKQISAALLDYIVEKIINAVNPKAIILFGSYARNDATASSDVDLFIVQDSEITNKEVRREIEKLLWGRHFGVDLIVRKPEEVARNLADNNPFYTEDIYAEGRVLYER